MKLYTPVFLVLLLSGCGQFGVRALANADAVADRIEERARKNFELREWYRDQCAEIVRGHVLELLQENRHIEAMEFLDETYPPLLTESMIRGFKEREEEGFRLDPWRCTGIARPEFNPQTGLLEGG